MDPLTFFSTPSHGYLVVPVALYRTVSKATGFRASAYSYRLGAYRDAGSVYLEEDVDAPAFLQALRLASGQEVPIREAHVEVLPGEGRLRPLSGVV